MCRALHTPCKPDKLHMELCSRLGSDCPEAVALLRGLLQPCPGLRMTASQAIKVTLVTCSCASTKQCLLQMWILCAASILLARVPGDGFGT